MVYLAADHGGYNLKAEIIKYLQENNIQFEDLGAYELVPEDNYPEYVLKLVERVRYTEGSQGIVLCRNGVGVSMLANKFKGIRAALVFTTEHAKSSKNDDNANVLGLPADYLSKEQTIEIVKTWLDTPFSNEDRHITRLNSVAQYGQE